MAQLREPLLPQEDPTPLSPPPSVSPPLSPVAADGGIEVEPDASMRRSAEVNPAIVQPVANVGGAASSALLGDWVGPSSSTSFAVVQAAAAVSATNSWAATLQETISRVMRLDASAASQTVPDDPNEEDRGQLAPEETSPWRAQEGETPPFRGFRSPSPAPSSLSSSSSSSSFPAPGDDDPTSPNLRDHGLPDFDPSPRQWTALGSKRHFGRVSDGSRSNHLRRQVSKLIDTVGAAKQDSRIRHVSTDGSRTDDECASLQSPTRLSKNSGRRFSSSDYGTSPLHDELVGTLRDIVSESMPHRRPSKRLLEQGSPAAHLLQERTSTSSVDAFGISAAAYSETVDASIPEHARAEQRRTTPVWERASSLEVAQERSMPQLPCSVRLPRGSSASADASTLAEDSNPPEAPADAQHSHVAEGVRASPIPSVKLPIAQGSTLPDVRLPPDLPEKVWISAAEAPEVNNTDPATAGVCLSPATRKPLGDTGDGETIADVVEEEFVKHGATISGVLFKRRSNLSRAAKVYKMLQKEAQAALSSEDWRVDRLGDLARQVYGLLGPQGAPKTSADNTLDTPGPTEGKELDTDGTGDAKAASNGSEEVGEAIWGRRHVWLEGATLVWAKPVDVEDSRRSGGKKNSVGPLWGGSVEIVSRANAEHHRFGGGSRHVFLVFPTPSARRRPLVFAASKAEDAERWERALTAACAFPVPPPKLRRPLCGAGCFVDCIRGTGPPKGYEPPCARIMLEVVRASGLRSQGRQINAFALGRVHKHQFRTSTRYHVGGQAVFAQSWTIPVELEAADESVQFEVFHEPEYEDHEPELLGGITVPLWMFGRNRRTELVLPLRMASSTRSGVVNASFGNLEVVGSLSQPLGHLWLPAEPPPADRATGARDHKEHGRTDRSAIADIEMQANRVDTLVQLVLTWQAEIAIVVQWEHQRKSLMWFIFLQGWVLLAWKWSLVIALAWLLKITLDLRPRETSTTSCLNPGVSETLPRAFGGQDDLEAQPPVTESIAPSTPRPASSDCTVQPRCPSLEPSPDRLAGQSASGMTMEGAAGTGATEPCDASLWEVQRRVVFVGFSGDYLSDFDPPMWSDENGKESSGPSTVVVHGELRYLYRWKVVVSEETDENGWQYAPAFSSTQWRRTFDTMHTWVRRRRHEGSCVTVVQDRLGQLPQTDNDMVALGLQAVTHLASGASCGDDTPAGLPMPVGGSFRPEEMVTENGLLRNYMQKYMSIRSDVEFWLNMIEKHLNLFTWKDRTVTVVVAWFVAAGAWLAVVLPTSWVFSLLVDLAFYVGFLTGKGKRQSRQKVLRSLADWCSKICGSSMTLRGSDSCTRLEENGITRLALRNWCNRVWHAGLDLRAVDQCAILADFADLVVQSSPKLNKAVPRYRAWHSDVYNNFLDHVPSDVAMHDIGSFCYQAPPPRSLV